MNEPQLAPASTSPPANLRGRARAEWIRLASELVSKGVLAAGDLTVFEIYCNLVVEVAEYTRLVRRVGRETAHRLGYASYLLKLRAQLKQYAAELGLTPSSRSGVKAVKTKDTVNEKRRRFFGGHAANPA